MSDTLLSPNHAPDFRARDRLNGWTRLLPCCFLEWSGWYSQSIRNRLIGHYRLYEHFQKAYERSPHPDIPVAQAYILHYRSNYGAKHLLSTAVSLFISPISSSSP